MRTVGRSAGLAALCCAALAGPVAAQGVPRVVELTIEVAPTAIAFPSPVVLDFDVGRIDHSGTVVSITSRPGILPWELRIRADAATLGGYGKPVGDILWRTATSTTWTALSGTDQTVAQGQGNADITVFFRMRLDWATDVPDTYAAGITLSVVRL